jgi:hypothetical protein
VKAIKNLEDLRAHLLSGDHVFIAIDNSWLHRFGLYCVIDLSYILNFSGKIKGIAIKARSLVVSKPTSYASGIVWLCSWSLS